jgi:hypothetical protein
VRTDLRKGFMAGQEVAAEGFTSDADITLIADADSTVIARVAQRQCRRAMERRAIAAHTARYGPEYLRALNRHWGHGAAIVAIDAAAAECGRQPHEVERRLRASNRWARQRGLTATPMPSSTATPRQRPRGAGRPRAAVRSSSRSGDSGEDGPEATVFGDPRSTRGSWPEFAVGKFAEGVAR